MKYQTRFVRRTRDIETLVESMSTSTAAAMAHSTNPAVLLYTPPARGNPFQQLLYSSALDAGIAPVPLLHLEELDGLHWPYPVAVHVHWTSSIAQTTDSEDEAMQAVSSAVETLTAARQRGMLLAWTVHNVLPHDCAWPAAEVELRTWLAAHADIVHILDQRTTAATAPHYQLPSDDRLVVVPHPTYEGVYPDHVSRSEARLELDIDQDAKVGVLVGSLRPNKGIDLLLGALSHLDRNWRFVIAGAPPDDETRDAIVAMADRDSRLDVWPRKVGIDEMQLFHRAADVAVLPYTGGLNSGVAFLAWTFGVPVVAPALGSFPTLVQPPTGVTFAPGDVVGLAAACEEVAGFEADAVAGAIGDLRSAHRPAVVSARLMEEIRSRLD